MWMRRIAVCVLVSLGMGAVTFGEEPERGVDWDEVSRSILERWEAREYRPVEAGLSGGSVVVEISVSGDRGQAEGVASYRWRRGDDPSTSTSELKWDPKTLGAMLSREGWSKERFDGDYLHLNQRGRFHGCRLLGERGSDGKAKIELEGKSASGLKELHFDESGILEKEIYEVRMGSGKPSRFSLSPVYREIQGHLVKVSEVFRMKVGGFGSVESTSLFEYAAVDGVLLLKGIRETSKWNGDPSGVRSFEFVDWKLERQI